jgi:hypothetical protein
MPLNDFCPDDCPDLRVEHRVDVHPAQKVYFCHGKWLGFIPRRHSGCQRDAEEEMPLFAQEGEP